ncbi:inositol monophosphatase family protein [Fictibacillus sp. FJAT-27399]|uniref:inositol monophosphatase family protein n=1 Tax=Fictibacillus sp. FJAT-27399 TaxID=1729689 RepID=UPI0007808462|nr:inositol monophosphatase family protein [Fictibacillus sp. FJAT-27399]
MDNTKLEDLYQTAKNWVYEAGEVIKRSFSNELNITYKSHYADLVTDMDKAIEKFFIDKIKKEYPDHEILGEEGYGDEVKDLDGTVWIIDPIDGTTNFVHQQNNFAISVGIFHNGESKAAFIYDVVRNELFHCIKGNGLYLNEEKLPLLSEVTLDKAVIGLNATWITPNRKIDHHLLLPLVRKSRGTRSYGTAAIELAYVACGRLDAYMTMRLSPWDFAAGYILIQEAGGIISTMDGKKVEVLSKTSIFAAKPGLHQEILDTIHTGTPQDGE